MWRTSIAILPNADAVTDFELCNLCTNSNDMADNFVARNDGLTVDVNHFRKQILSEASTNKGSPQPPVMVCIYMRVHEHGLPDVAGTYIRPAYTTVVDLDV